MKRNMKKVLSAATGAAMLAGGAMQAAVAEVEYEVKVSEAHETSYAKVANVAGEFSFDQHTVTPADEIFNLFGTVSTAMCARPGFAFDKADSETRFINFGGSVLKDRTISLDELKEKGSETRLLKCSCATGAAVANAEITGVPLSRILQLVDVEDGTNTVTFTGTDGYSVSVPLTYALEKNALLVYQVEGTPVPTGTQVWMPQSVARYFTRSLANVEFSIEENLPEILHADASQRAKVSIMNRFEDTVFQVGDQIEFEGYADDFDKAITIYLPSTLRYADDMSFSLIFINGLYMLWCTEPDMLPDFHVDAFYRCRHIFQFYFTEETIQNYGDELDERLNQLSDVGTPAWYYQGKEPYWSLEPLE